MAITTEAEKGEIAHALSFLPYFWIEPTVPTQHLICIQMYSVSTWCPAQKQGQSSQPWLSLSYSQHRWLITKHISPSTESQPVHNALHLYHIRCFWNASDRNAVREGTSLLRAPRADNGAGVLRQWQAASGMEEGSSCSAAKTLKRKLSWSGVLLPLGTAWLSLLGDRLLVIR